MEWADVSVVPSGRDKFSDALPDTACLANFRLSLWDKTERQPRRGGIFVETNQPTKIISSSVRSGICRPDGAGEFFDAGFYKDFAPDGAVDGPRLCPQDQSQRVRGSEGLGLFRCVKMFGRAAADPAARDTAALQP